MIPFPLFLAAAASLCIISISFGISWGMQMAAVKFTKEVRDEALHNFEEKFYNKFVRGEFYLFHCGKYADYCCPQWN